MTTTLVPRSEAEIDQLRVTLNNVLTTISNLPSVADVQEARARTEALRAWAKAHKRVKEVRLELLRIEMAALIRIIELGGGSDLPDSDRRAAEWLAAMDAADREDLLANSRSATTVVGMCRSVWAEEDNRRLRQQLFSKGMAEAKNPTAPPTDDDEVRERRDRVVGVRSALSDLVRDHTRAWRNDPFTVEEIAQELIEDAALDPYLEEDAVLRQGVREVVRKAIAEAPVLTIDNTVIPATITARNEDGVWLRIPTAVAKVAHLDDCIGLRAEQLQQDSASLERLQAFRDRLGQVPGCAPNATIGDLVSTTITGTKETS